MRGRARRSRARRGVGGPMTRVRGLLLAAMICFPAVAFAGFPQGRIIPTLGEVGLVALGVSLLGGGALALRRRKR